MYRVFAIAFASILLASCGSTPDWMKVDTEMFKPKPLTDSVRLESEPPGADAKVGGQTCRTPCSLELQLDQKYTVVFNLNGYQPETDSLEPVSMGDGQTRLRPNPLLVELTPAPPPPKPVVKPKPRKKKPAVKPKPKPASAAAPAAAAPPPGAPPPTPWPGSPPAQR